MVDYVEEVTPVDQLSSVQISVVPFGNPAVLVRETCQGANRFEEWLGRRRQEIERARVEQIVNLDWKRRRGVVGPRSRFTLRQDGARYCGISMNVTTRSRVHRCWRDLL